jgi:hypothetical protein
VGELPLGFEETGIVASQSSALAEADPPISIFYVSTYSNGFVFVGVDDIDRAVAVLKTQFPRVVQEQFVLLPDPLLSSRRSSRSGEAGEGTGEAGAGAPPPRGILAGGI